jgi:hypothetical protein
LFLAGASGDAAEEPTKEREKQTSLDNRRQLTPLNTKVSNRSIDRPKLGISRALDYVP